MNCVCDKVFRAVDDPPAILSHCGRARTGGVRTGARLGQSPSAQTLAASKRNEVFLFLFFVQLEFHSIHLTDYPKMKTSAPTKIRVSGTSERELFAARNSKPETRNYSRVNCTLTTA